MRRWVGLAAGARTGVATMVALALLAWPVSAQVPEDGATIWDGVFTAEQAEQGARIAQGNCLMCHSTSEWGNGRLLRLWSERPILAFYESLRGSMPYDNPGSLSREEYAAVVAYLLSLNDAPSGDAPLASDAEGLGRVQVTPEPEPSALAGAGPTEFDPSHAAAGAVDLHVHSAPDSRPRSIHALDMARLAGERGMWAIVLKNHYEPTAGLAYLAREEVPGLEVFGGIALNTTVGGINAAAVEHMTRVTGGRGRVVWMPTFDSENQVRASGEDRPFVSVSRDGELLPEVKEVIGLVAEHDLALATGHSSPEEVLLLLRYARERGVQRMVVTHAMFPPIRMTVAQMKEAAAEGAFLEFPAGPPSDEDPAARIDRIASAIREVGPDHVILSSDLGQEGAPLPPDGFADFLVALHESGFSEAEMARMAKQNPARLLGLPLDD